MKFFYVLSHQFVSIFLSANTVTTLHFPSEIVSCDYGVSKSALASKIRRQRTTISLIPKKEGIDSNMTCYMKDGGLFVFNLKWSKNRVHKNIVVKKALNKRGGVKILETKSFKLFDAGKNYYIENKTKKTLTVNESKFEKAGVVSKWSPILINGKEYRL